MSSKGEIQPWAECGCGCGTVRAPDLNRIGESKPDGKPDGKE